MIKMAGFIYNSEKELVWDITKTYLIERRIHYLILEQKKRMDIGNAEYLK